MTVVDPGLGPGARLGRYILLRERTRTAAGASFEAYDPEIGRRLVLDVIGGEGLAADIRREVKALAAVASPYLPAVHDVGEVDGRVFVARELTEGAPLATWIHTGAPTVRALREILAAAGRGLHACHVVGAVHGSFGMGSLVVHPRRGITVADWGPLRPRRDAPRSDDVSAFRRLVVDAFAAAGHAPPFAPTGEEPLAEVLARLTRDPGRFRRRLSWALAASIALAAGTEAAARAGSHDWTSAAEPRRLVAEAYLSQARAARDPRSARLLQTRAAAAADAAGDDALARRALAALELSAATR